ncbi:MAG: hypothetical protein WBB28_11205 [Crinalium sp.]
MSVKKCFAPPGRERCADLSVAITSASIAQAHSIMAQNELENLHKKWVGGGTR